MHRIFCFLSFVVLLSSCIADQEVVTGEKYFDLPLFIENEIIHLESNNTTLTKKVYSDGEKDSVLIEKPNWRKELQIFTNLNINKPAFIGKYDVTQNTDQAFHETQYKALDSTLQIRSLSVRMKNDTVQGVILFKEDHSMFLDNSIYLSYWPSQFYHIKGYRNLLGVESNYEVKGYFR